MPGGNTTRNQVWSGIVLLIVVSLLIGIYFLWVSNEPVSSPDPTLVVMTKANTDVVSSDTFINYTNEDYEFSVQYPDNWTVTTDSSGDGPDAIFSASLRGGSEGVIISVMPTSLEGVVRNSISVISEIEIDVNGTTAQKLIGTNAKDGSEYTVVLLEHNDKLYSISGGGQILDDVVSYFEIR